MKFKTILGCCIIFFLYIFSVSCDKDDIGNESMISKLNDKESHKHGQNCMTCHISGGEGEGWFTMAGSVFEETLQNPYPNATIKLYTGENGSGTLIKTIEVDGNGNFYTTEEIDFSEGLFTSVTSSDKNELFMEGSFTTGECNNCHGNFTNYIWVK